jgi:multiple sugar transport system substrate-binding protein
MGSFEKSLFDAFAARRLGRRELLDRAAKLGLGAAATSALLNAAQSRAMAADYDWMANKGTNLHLLLNKHPYADAMIANLKHFEAMTGINVTYDVFPEDVYFDKVTAGLSSKSSQYDVFMTGAYQTWQYGPAGWLVDLNEFINDPAKTAPTYDWADILPNLRSSTSWSGKPGEALGGPGAKQWALPWGFEINDVSYNKKILATAGISPPTNLPDLIDKAGSISSKVPGVYGIGVRGSRSWATIHAGYLSGFTNYGAKDFSTDGGNLKPTMNSAEGKAFTKLWVDMLHKGGPKNWTQYTWYEVGNDLGAGASAMIYDADILGFFQETGTKEAGNIGFEAFAANPDAKSATPNVWIWSLAMSAFSGKRDAAWQFMQWASGTEQLTYGATKANQVDPVRQSVWNDPDFKTRLTTAYPGFLEQFDGAAPGAKIYFTPQPLFFNLTTDWAAALQEMYSGQIPVDEGLDKLAANITSQLQDAGISN